MTSKSKPYTNKNAPGLYCTLSLIYMIASLNPASACGWWGDGEMTRHTPDILSTSNGTPVSARLDLQTARLPGRKGYGIVVLEPGKAVPYLYATFGRPIVRIGELKSFGFSAVIDLGPSQETAQKHQVETEKTGMRYFSIAITENVPTHDQVRRFNQIVSDTRNGAVLVYTPQAPDLGAMWALHRFSLGAPIGFAVAQGKSLGLTKKQEAELYKLAAGRKTN